MLTKLDHQQISIKEPQNFLQLSCIQSVSLGLPVVIIGKQLYEQYGAGTAICSIFVGNLILWLIGLAIISMVYQAHTNAIENIKGYIGKYGSALFALVLIFAFIDWYASQINSTVTGIGTLLSTNYRLSGDIVIRIGATLGILSALLAIGGIRLLKWLTVVSFPLVICYSFAIIIASDFTLKDQWKWGISFSGIISTILILLPGVINLPTFFRHSRSRADSFLALTFMTIFITFFECSTLWMSFSSGSEFILKNLSPPNLVIFVIPTIIFLVITSICSNLLNIYLASACYETFIPRFQSTKGHAIMGLLGTCAYTFVQVSSPVQFLTDLFDCYIGVLGVVLLIGVLARIIIKHRPRRFEKIINLASWILGCTVATFLLIQAPNDWDHSLLLGMGTSALFFLVVFFIEETWWSAQKIKAGKTST